MRSPKDKTHLCQRFQAMSLGSKEGFFISKKADNRFPLRLDDLTRWKIESWYKRADCQSRNEFVERAVNFYADYLDGQQNGILPAAIQSAIDGRLGMFEDRMAKLLYKLTGEMDMGMNAVLDCVQMDDDYLRKLRTDSVRSVKATNGLLTIEQKVREHDDNTEGENQWQG